nr:immunoglobulin heavy chain junction region [Mus musculus]
CARLRTGAYFDYW